MAKRSTVRSFDDTGHSSGNEAADEAQQRIVIGLDRVAEVRHAFLGIAVAEILAFVLRTAEEGQVR